MPEPKGNYFPIPNEIFNMDLTASEIALYAFLMRMEDRKTYTCYPSFKTIAEALKMGSKNTVMKYVRLLEEKELIETEHTIVEHHDGSLRNGNLMFRILPVNHASKSPLARSFKASVTQEKGQRHGAKGHIKTLTQ